MGTMLAVLLGGVVVVTVAAVLPLFVAVAKVVRARRVQTMEDTQGTGPVGEVPVVPPTPMRRCRHCMGHGKRLRDGVEEKCTWCGGAGSTPDYSSVPPSQRPRQHGIVL